MDELEAMVVELFSEVENKNTEAIVWNSHPYKEDQLKTIVYINPVKDVRNLNIIFPCEDLTSYYKSGVTNTVFLLVYTVQIEISKMLCCCLMLKFYILLSIKWKSLIDFYCCSNSTSKIFYRVSKKYGMSSLFQTTNIFSFHKWRS